MSRRPELEIPPRLFHQLALCGVTLIVILVTIITLAF